VNRVTPKYVQTLEDMHKTLPEWGIMYGFEPGERGWLKYAKRLITKWPILK
jgi:hypothetical protein